MDTLSSNLKYLMLNKKLTSSELARKTGIGQPVIHRLMTGDTSNPQILTIKPIADFFGISIDQLLGFIPIQQAISSDNLTLHHINNKLSTIKTIGSVLIDILPYFILSYEKALSANLVEQEIPLEVLPLLQLNSTNLIKCAEQIQNLLTINGSKTKE